MEIQCILNYLSKGNVFLGSDTSPPTITVNKCSSGNGNAFEVAGNSIFSGTVSTNTLNSEGDNDLVFQRNDVEFFKLDKFTENTVENEAIICSKQLRANATLLVRNLQINHFPVGVEYADFRLEDADSVMRFYAGNSTSVDLQLANTDITLGRLVSRTAGLKTNFIDTYTDTDLSITLQGTNISPKNGILKMIFLFPRWDMLIPWSVEEMAQKYSNTNKGIR